MRHGQVKPDSQAPMGRASEVEAADTGGEALCGGTKAATPEHLEPSCGGVASEPAALADFNDSKRAMCGRSCVKAHRIMSNLGARLGRYRWTHTGAFGIYSRSQTLVARRYCASRAEESAVIDQRFGKMPAIPRIFTTIIPVNRSNAFRSAFCATAARAAAYLQNYPYLVILTASEASTRSCRNCLPALRAGLPGSQTSIASLYRSRKVGLGTVLVNLRIPRCPILTPRITRQRAFTFVDLVRCGMLRKSHQWQEAT